ncbi:allantoicase-like [Toxorhynchites rutilus septentrionalis]|uniref:allantoicase-like n=1 Tax=Toxorhynchites rutilus septentrionalis TaxID=329112 RepID=UPI00247AB73E|nr:allantoicase-like [Toxorhynchites rutilus septentrionalis]
MLQENGTTEPAAFLQLSELASESSGGRILFSTDDFFAPAEGMLRDEEPIFIPDKYTDFGKWMDGWETRRKRIAGHDWCIVRLAAPTVIKGIVVDTAHFTGNFAPRMSIQGARIDPRRERQIAVRREGSIGTGCDGSEMEEKIKNFQWEEIVQNTPLKPGYDKTRKHYFGVDTNENVFTHLRVNIYPDGGIARLRVYGVVQPDRDSMADSAELVDLIAMLNGGQCLEFSNAHYGHPRNLIKPQRGANMGDGWETARRNDRPAILTTDERGILKVPGCEWAVFKLGMKGTVRRIVLDTNHFKGNFPDSVRIEAALLREDQDLEGAKWTVMLDNRKLSAHKEHIYEEDDLLANAPCTHIRITIAPDGGISRLRLFGRCEK